MMAGRVPPHRDGHGRRSWGSSCAIGILAAVSTKIQTGEGQKVDVALVDSAVASLEIINMIYLAWRPDPPANRQPVRIHLPPYDSSGIRRQPYHRRRERYKLYVFVREAAARPDLAEDPRFLRVSGTVGCKTMNC